jgi:hypothetical protein
VTEQHFPHLRHLKVFEVHLCQAPNSAPFWVAYPLNHKQRPTTPVSAHSIRNLGRFLALSQGEAIQKAKESHS